MATTETATNEIAIWERILRPTGGEMSVQTAQAILRFSMAEADRATMRTLLAKAKGGALSPSEELELDEYERCGNVLSILKAKARRVLKSKA
jgi:hypothetical protein